MTLRTVIVRRSNRGFTMLELILVISITSVIALVIARILEQSGNLYFRMVRNADAHAAMQQTYHTMLTDIRESVGAATISSSQLDLDKKYYDVRWGGYFFPDVLCPYNATRYQIASGRINVSNYWDPIEDIPSSTSQSFSIPQIAAGTAWSSVVRGGNNIYTVTLVMNVNGQVIQSRFSASPIMEN